MISNPKEWHLVKPSKWQQSLRNWILNGSISRTTLNTSERRLNMEELIAQLWIEEENNKGFELKTSNFIVVKVNIVEHKQKQKDKKFKSSHEAKWGVTKMKYKFQRK